MTPQQRLAHQNMMNKLPVHDHIDKENRPQNKRTGRNGGKNKKTGRSGGKKGADHFRKQIKIPVFR